LRTKLLEGDHGQQAWYGSAAGITWKGAGAWLIRSQSRQENFSRTCWITFHDFQGLGNVLTQFA
jgi:hypothetical protein